MSANAVLRTVVAYDGIPSSLCWEKNCPRRLSPSVAYSVIVPMRSSILQQANWSAPRIRGNGRTSLTVRLRSLRNPKGVPAPAGPHHSAQWISGDEHGP